ncbi:drug/metabolite transporter (DMT)-like permease [Flavobacterium sp. CG_9.1]|nr:drug/metabolite transporter (DMT)-like permease [Flavobacterium sp. CG_9.1]
MKFPHIALYRFLITSILFIPFIIKKKKQIPNKSNLKAFILATFFTVPCQISYLLFYIKSQMDDSRQVVLGY